MTASTTSVFALPDEETWQRSSRAAMTVGRAWLRDRQTVLVCIAQLSTDQRRCIELRMLRGRTVAETATELRRSANAVYMLQQRAVQRLAELLGAEQRPARAERPEPEVRGGDLDTVRAMWRHHPDLFERSLDRLSPDQRHYLELRVVRGMAIPRIATVMQRTENATYVLQYRALRRMCALLADPVSEPQPGPMEVVRTALRHDRPDVRRCLEMLNDSQRDCVELRLLQGLSVAETAVRMQRTENAVRVLLHGAVRRLADLLSGGSSPTPNEVMDAVVAAAQHEPDRLLAQLGQLSPSQRQCIELRFLRKRTVAETATIMVRGAASIRTLQVTASRRLADSLACMSTTAPVHAARTVTESDRAALEAAIELLETDLQQCARLRLLDSLSCADTAAAMGRSYRAVRVLYYTAVAGIAELLPTPAQLTVAV